MLGCISRILVLMDFNPLPVSKGRDFHCVVAVSCSISRSCSLWNSFILDEIGALINDFFFFLKEWTESPTRRRLIETGDAYDHPAWTPKFKVWYCLQKMRVTQISFFNLRNTGLESNKKPLQSKYPCLPLQVNLIHK